MATKSQSRDERIDIRVNAEAKALFLKAAELSGQNLSGFIVESVRQRAVEIIEDYNRIRLNDQARDVFLNALANPPAPGEALRRAADKFAAK